MSTESLRLARLIVAHEDGEAAKLATAILRLHKERKTRRASKPGSSRKTEKRAEREERNERVAKIREAVFARAGNRCEAFVQVDFNGPPWLTWRRCPLTAVSMDHWLGGNGRRQAEEAVDTCWALCSVHDRDRTHNNPSTAHWNISHRRHCEEHGYHFTPHYDARAGARARAEGER